NSPGSKRRSDLFAAAYHSLHRSLETAVLVWLEKEFSVGTNVALKTRRKRPAAFGWFDYHEIDFVLMSDGSPKLLGELKISSAPAKALAHARRQLRVRIAHASRRWPHVRGLALC